MARLKSSIKYLLLVAIAIIAALPFYSMLVMGTYKTQELYLGVKLAFGGSLLKNFTTLQSAGLERNYLNSIIVAISTTLLTLLVCSLAGVGYAKYTFRGKKAFFNFVLLTLLVPTQLGLVAFVMEMRLLGWTSTLLPLIIPHAANSFSAFFIMQYAQTAIPIEVMESARLDGCTEGRIYLSICLPFLRPALVTVALLVFLWTWNNFLEAFVVLTKEELYTIPLAIKTLSTRYARDIGAQILGLSIGTLPMLFIFAFFNRNLIDGLAATAVKG